MPFLSDVIKTVYEELAQRILSDKPMGLTTGVPELDEMIGDGWERQRLTYLVGDSGVGKSYLATSWIIRGAKWLQQNPGQRPASGYFLSGEAENDRIKQAIQEKTNKPPVIVFWSLEMDAYSVGLRLVSQVVAELTGQQLDAGKLMRGNLGAPRDSPEWEATRQTLGETYKFMRQDFGQHICMEFETKSVKEFRKILDELSQAYDICMIVIDYFRLIAETASDGNMATLQEERSRSLHELKRDYDCHVLAIFDINREGQKSSSPGAQHMRGGVAAHYDADLVLVVQNVDEEETAGPTHHLLLKVAKGRHVAQNSMGLAINLASGYVEAWRQRRPTVHSEVWDALDVMEGGLEHDESV